MCENGRGFYLQWVFELQNLVVFGKVSVFSTFCELWEKHVIVIRLYITPWCGWMSIAMRQLLLRV